MERRMLKAFGFKIAPCTFNYWFDFWISKWDKFMTDNPLKSPLLITVQMGGD
jgi:hypothetical protein